MITPPVQQIRAMKSWEVPSIQQIGTWRMRIRVDDGDEDWWMKIGAGGQHGHGGGVLKFGFSHAGIHEHLYDQLTRSMHSQRSPPQAPPQLK